MDFFFLLPDGSYFLLPDGGRLIIGTDAPPAPPTPTPTPAVSRGGGYADGQAKGKSRPQTLDEASRHNDERRLRETKAQLKAILEDDAEVMQIIERLLEAIDKN